MSDDSNRIKIDSRSTGCLLITGSIATSVAAGLIYGRPLGLLTFGATCLGFALVGVVGHIVILFRQAG